MIQDVIESILDNESITDGLTDEHAQLIIQWCLEKVETFQSQDDQELAEYGHYLTQRARTIAKIANHIQDGDDVRLIQRRLQRLTDHQSKQQSLLKLINKELPLDEYIHVVLKLAEEGQHAR